MELILTKLMPPRLDSRAVPRNMVNDLIPSLQNKKAIVITAPPGYGKTVLMRQLLVQLNQPFIWYQLDNYDNDPAVFFQYLIHGIRQYLPGFGREILEITQQGIVTPNLRLIVTAFCNRLAQAGKNFF